MKTGVAVRTRSPSPANTLIRWCYLVFMYGFVLSVLAYAVALFFFPVEG